MQSPSDRKGQQHDTFDEVICVEWHVAVQALVRRLVDGLKATNPELAMSVARINEFRAKEEKSDALRAFLTQIVPTIASSTGCLSCQLLQGHENPTRLVVIEVRDSIESHQASMSVIPPEEFAEVMELLDGTPVGECYHE